MIFLFLFLLGLCIGSFLNVVILRTNTGEGVRGRSRCFSCLQKLEWYDLVPLASFLSIRGRCRYCSSKISLQYPAVELITGLIFALAGYLLLGDLGMIDAPHIVQFVLVCGFFSTLVAISVYDLWHKIIPDQFSVALFTFALAGEIVAFASGLRSADEVWIDMFSALGAFVFFGGIWFLSQGRWMGFGDAKIAISIGLFLGYPGIFMAVLFAFWIGAIIAVGLLLFQSYSLKMEVPFAPFFALGTLAAFVIISSDAFVLFYKYLTVI